jgi:hypothetical protein
MAIVFEHCPAEVAGDSHYRLLARLTFCELCDAAVAQVVKSNL